jgi:hypothetical protein
VTSARDAVPTAWAQHPPPPTRSRAGATTPRGADPSGSTPRTHQRLDGLLDGGPQRPARRDTGLPQPQPSSIDEPKTAPAAQNILRWTIYHHPQFFFLRASIPD